MRILRSQSNIEVSYRGFALFVVGLILATFIGGAIRTILSSDRVQSRIVSELKSRFPRNEFNVGHTEILLSQGLWPGLALRLHDVVFRQDVCGKLSFVLEAPESILPVDLLSLFRGRVRLGTVDVESGMLRLDYRDCAVSSAESPTDKGATPSSSSASIRSTVATRGIRPLGLDWSQISNALRGLRLHDFVVTYARNLTWKLVFSQADVRLSDEMRLHAAVDVQKSLPFGTLSHPVKVEAHGDQKNLEWTVHALFNEGHLSWHGLWNQIENVAESDLKLVQIPVKDVSNEMFQMGFVEREINLKTAWLTCSANWQGALQNWQAQPVQLRACKLEGAYGRADLEQADIYAGADPALKEPAQLRVQKLQLQPLVESLGRQVLPAVMGRLGVWTGSLAYTSKNSWQLDGLLENAEINFSNESIRGKQVLRSMHTQAQRSGEVTEARVDNILLQDGECKGEVVFHLSEDWRSGEFDATFDRVSLSPTIQNLFIGGSLSPVSVKGHGQLVGGDLNHWSGDVRAADVRGSGWRVEGVEIKSRYSGSAVHLDVKAARAAIESRWNYFRQLESLRETSVEAIGWRDISSQLDVDRSGGVLTHLSAVRVSPVQVWRASGSWRRDGEFRGRLLQEAGGAVQSFQVKGQKGVLAVLNERSESE